MNGLMKRLSAVAMAVGMLMTTNISHLPTEPFIANAAESETSDAEETVHIWDGTTDVSWYDDEETEFHISTPEQLAGMAAIVNTGKTMEGKTFILDNDIYLNDVSTYDEWETTPPENKWTPLKIFSGTFLGENHSIIGHYGISGFFSSVVNGHISEIHLVDSYASNFVKRTTSCGMLIDESKSSLITNCSIQGIFNFSSTSVYNGKSYDCPNIYIGGITSSSSHDKIVNCTNSINFEISGIAKNLLVGGICGTSDSSNIVNCVNNGNITATYNVVTSCYVGGICGESSGKITNCKNCGDLSCIPKSASSELSASGICGLIEDTVTDCYNIGKIEAMKCAGIGICSADYSIAIENVYNIGAIVESSEEFSEEPSYKGSYGITYREYSKKCSLQHAYYLSGTALRGMNGTDSTIVKSETNMKKESFADSLGEAFYYIEGEYPKLAFEVGRTVSNFDKTSLSFNEYGETQTLTLDTTYLGTPEWVSSDTSVATVDENGVVTAVGNGTAMIYALCSDSKAACSVSVGYDYYLSDNELSLKKGRVHDLTVYSASTNEEVTDVEIEWNSSDDSIVSVDNEGKLIANNKGTAAVTAKIADIELSCIVNVYEYTVPVTPTEDDKNAPQLSETEFTISTIESKKLSVLNYTDSITWVSSNTAIAKVNDQGLVRAVAEGQTSVYALLSDGKCLKANVTVTKSEYSMGDVNLDGEFDVADVVLLQKWLLAVPDIELKHWENADFYEDGMLNVFDLCMMREQLIS